MDLFALFLEIGFFVCFSGLFDVFGYRACSLGLFDWLSDCGLTVFVGCCFV